MIEREPEVLLLFMEFWAYGVRDAGVRSKVAARFAQVRELLADTLPHVAALLDQLEALEAEFPGLVFDVRGRGLMCAFSLPSAAQRDELIQRLWDRRVIMLASGPTSVRFRPALTVSRDEIDDAVAAVRDALS